MVTVAKWRDGAIAEEYIWAKERPPVRNVAQLPEPGMLGKRRILPSSLMHRGKATRRRAAFPAEPSGRAAILRFPSSSRGGHRA